MHSERDPIICRVVSLVIQSEDGVLKNSRNLRQAQDKRISFREKTFPCMLSLSNSFPGNRKK